MCENLPIGCKNEPKGEWTCRFTFNFWHGMQVLVQSVQSFLMDGQIIRSLRGLYVLFIPGWFNPWIMSKTFRRNGVFKKGRGFPVGVSSEEMASIRDRASATTFLEPSIYICIIWSISVVNFDINDSWFSWTGGSFSFLCVKAWVRGLWSL